MNPLRWREKRKKGRRGRAEAPPPRRRRFAVADLSGERERQTEALVMAICAGDTDGIRRILDDDHCCADFGSETLNCACATGNALSVRLLLEHGAALNSTGGKGDAALHTAVRRNAEPIARILIVDFNADVNVQTKYERRTPLHLAAALDRRHLATILLSNGAEVNRPDIYGSTALHLAAEAGSADGVRVLLQFNADPDLFNKDGWTAMHLASAGGHVTVVDHLIKVNANVDCQNQFGRTPLHWACAQGHRAVVRLLLHHGASVTARDKHGRTAVDHSVSRGIAGMVEEVGGGGGAADRLSFFPRINSCIHFAAAAAAAAAAADNTELRDEALDDDGRAVGRRLASGGSALSSGDGATEDGVFPSFRSVGSSSFLSSAPLRLRRIGIWTNEGTEDMGSTVEEEHEADMSAEESLYRLVQLNQKFKYDSANQRNEQEPMTSEERSGRRGQSSSSTDESHEQQFRRIGGEIISRGKDVHKKRSDKEESLSTSHEHLRRFRTQSELEMPRTEDSELELGEEEAADEEEEEEARKDEAGELGRSLKILRSQGKWSDDEVFDTTTSRSHCPNDHNNYNYNNDHDDDDDDDDDVNGEETSGAEETVVDLLNPASNETTIDELAKTVRRSLELVSSGLKQLWQRFEQGQKDNDGPAPQDQPHRTSPIGLAP